MKKDRTLYLVLSLVTVCLFQAQHAHAWKNGVDEATDAKLVVPGTFGSYPVPTQTNKVQLGFSPAPSGPTEEGPDDVADEHRFQLQFSFFSFESCKEKLSKAENSALGLYTAAPNGGMALIDDIPKFCRGLFVETGFGQPTFSPPSSDPTTAPQPQL